MSASLIRSRAMVTHAIDRHRWNEITDGAVLQEDGTIVEIGIYQELSRKHPNVPVIGSGNEVMLPGFVNGHHHIGLTPVQLGSPDMPLELWFVTRMVMRSVNLYLDTLYSGEGEVVLQWPEPLGSESYEDFESWLKLVLRKVKRAVQEPERAGEVKS